jgi:carboxypeptidase family protein
MSAVLRGFTHVERRNSDNSGRLAGVPASERTDLMQRSLVPTWLVAVTFVCSTFAHAQGVQTGTVTGLVNSADGLPLPGVTVTAASTALQGERSTVTDTNGVYYVRALPAGTYIISYDIPSFQPSTRTGVVVNVGGVTELDATLSVAAVTETVTVAGQAPSLAGSVATGQTYSKREVDAFPIGRRPVDIAELAPGVTSNTFAAGQLIIGGAFGFDNIFMMNGVDVNENLFGSANDLFIEDAILETSVLEHGISAAYGRFSGGVVNVVTKSGGNSFSGSFRENLSNPAWITETPRQKQNAIVNPSRVNKNYEGTFGGPIVRDRVWFFSAARYEHSDTANTFTQTGGSWLRTVTNKRAELKLTGTVAPSHTLQGTYINNSTEQANTSGLPLTTLVDASTLYTRQLPNHLFALNYNGVMASNALASFQYSHKKDGRRNNGGRSTDIRNSPFVTAGATPGVPGFLFYHAPFFDATDPEDRNNQQLTGSLSYLLSSDRLGSHDLKGGAEYFVNTGIGGNSQSPTGYVFNTDYVVLNGSPVVDANGRPIPRFTPGVSLVWNTLATRGAQIDIKTTSLYFEDRWTATRRLTVTLGSRFEAVRSDATGDITTVDTTSFVPRLGAAYDIQGDGSTTLQATYGHYSGRYNQVQFSANTSVSNPSEVDYVYSGPAGEGSDFAPGFDIANYRQAVSANFPTANVAMRDGIQSPIVREFTLGVARRLGQNGHARSTYVWRTTSHFIDDFIDRSTGVTDISVVGTVANRVYDNTDVPSRDYQALIFQSDYRPWSALMVGGHYTLQLRNHGNFVGESAARPIPDSVFGNYPEIFEPALDRLLPEGRLDNYQQHKLRVYGIYTSPFGRFGSLDVAPVWRVNSGTVYSHTATLPLTAVQLARNPGYPAININPAVRQTIFFGERGENSFKGYGVVDLAATYTVPVWRALAPWLKLEIYNALNNQKQIAWDRTVSVDQNSARDANGIPTGFIRGPRYGTATSDTQFPQPYLGQIGSRAVRLAFGIRF